MALLFIDGGDEYARWVYEHERRGYWATAFPLMLEKHGHLCYVRGDVELLQQPERWPDYDVVLVARLPDSAWTERAIRAAVEGSTPVVVEAPAPSAILESFGISASGGGVDDGSLVCTDPDLGTLARNTYGVAAGGPVTRPAWIRVSRMPEMDWQARPAVPLDRVQAASWRAPGWAVQHWALDGDSKLDILAQWQTWGTSVRRPAVVRRGNLHLFALGVFGFLGQAHTAEPSDGAEHRGAPRVSGVEAFVLSLIDSIYARSGLDRIRLLPWPDGVTWVRTVRHDFDRALTADQVAKVLSDHARVGSSATWYWRAEPRRRAARTSWYSADLRPAALVAATPSHEVALHTELLWSQADVERGVLEAAIMRPVRGTTAHGAPNCFRYQGAPNILWAEQQAMLYTEFLNHSHLHPHHCALLTPSGEIRVSAVLCLPNHLSFDASTTASNRQAVEQGLNVFVRTRGLAQIMNHPDVNQADLFDCLAAMPADGRADWTAAEAAQWWLATHSSRALTVRREDSRTFAVIAATSLQSVQFEISRPDGSLALTAVDLPSKAQVRVAA